MRQRGNNKHTVTAAAFIEAAPERVYSIIADYRNGHPRILPGEYDGLIVERGGLGAGTIIRFGMRLLGKTQTYRAAITEPEPGRVLVETVLDAKGVTTTFTVRPGPGGLKSDVTISTEVPVRHGLLGAVERFLATRFLRQIFRKQLTLLAERAK